MELFLVRGLMVCTPLCTGCTLNHPAPEVPLNEVCLSFPPSPCLPQASPPFPFSFFPLPSPTLFFVDSQAVNTKYFLPARQTPVGQEEGRTRRGSDKKKRKLGLSLFLSPTSFTPLTLAFHSVSFLQAASAFNRDGKSDEEMLPPIPAAKRARE